MGAARVDLPTYAFQRQRYWLQDGPEAALGDLTAVGMAAGAHPLLGAVLDIAGEGSRLCTARLSQQAQPWLARHRVGEVAVLPTTALVDLLTHVGEQVGAPVIGELTVSAPIVVPDVAGTVVQLVLDAPDTDGHRALRVHSRTDATTTDPDGWQEHAVGTLLPWDGVTTLPHDLTTWPPRDAAEVTAPEADGVTAVWAAEGRLYAEVALPATAEDEADADRYGVHPAVLDAALRLAGRLDGTASVAPGEGLLGHSVRGARAHATGARSLRVCLTTVGEGTVAVSAADDDGSPVLGIEAVALRPLTAEELPAGEASFTRDSLFEVEWVPVQAGQADAAVAWSLYDDLSDLPADRVLPPVVVFDPAADDDPRRTLPERVHTVTQRVLEVLQGWLADPRTADSRLVVVTQDGPAGSDAELVAEPVRGLLRSAQSENPGRFALLQAAADAAADATATEPAAAPIGTEALRAGLAAGPDEPWVAVRDGRPHVARLKTATTTAATGASTAPAPASATPAAPAPVSTTPAHATATPETAPPATITTDLRLSGGVALVTGATGGLGRLVVRHLADAHGVRELVLVSRSGRDPHWADELAALGLNVRMVAADVADREAMAELVGSIGDRLTAVVHTAGVVADGLLSTLTADDLHAVLRPKVDAAWHLHELTADLPLRAFVLFSSAASVFGGAGQGNYVAANAFLDALAAYRHAHGLPAVSLAWGLWGPELGGMGGGLGEVDLARIAREGILPLSAAHGLSLFDAGLTSGRAALVPVRLDLAALRAGDHLPAVLRGLAPRATRRAVTRQRAAAAQEGPALPRRLAGVAPADRHKALLDLVRESAAQVLGHASVEAVGAVRPFKDTGFDSLTGVELRNRLAAETGLALPATLVFDYATPTALARHLHAELLGTVDEAAGSTAPAAPVATAATTTDDEPIAVVGMGCRYSGGADSPEGLWRMLAAGDDTIVEFPADRGWDIDSLYHPDPDHLGTTYVRTGSFLEGAGDFDPTFFGIAPREAVAMDPQQRLLLETSWEAIERAGIDPMSLRGSRTGVFAGTNGQDYSALMQRSPRESEGYLATGIAASVVSGRISYTFGFEGPALSVDTACSSSLVALHLAVQALRNGECALALAGGVSVMTSPGLLVEFSRQRGLSPDGRCKSFSDDADGTGWGEGAGMLLLERLSDARRNGHNVLAVVRGSAVNQDGASNGLTAPNGPSQQRVIRAALANARLSASDIDAVEAHGTGTTLGDPIEAQALLATYGQDRDRPLWLGSVKSNIGHTQAAAGVAGVIKMVEAMRHGVLPRTLHVGTPSSKVDWSAGAVELLTEAREWQSPVDRPRRAGVSSFGVSGTNAHVILEQAPETEPAEEAGPAVPVEPVAVPWLLSARSADALREQAARLRAHVESGADLSPVNVGWTLANRAQFEHRAVVVGKSRDGLITSLGDVNPGTVGSGGRTVFVFPGQGSQWAGMGAELLDTAPVFAACVADCGEALAEFVDWDLEAVLRGAVGAPSLERVDVVQPVSWAVMVSLAALWRSYGVEPSAVVGHSQGEIAAACVAGALSLQDGARVVALRSQAIAAGLAGHGGMVSLALDAETAAARITAWDGRIEIAALNGPTSVVVAGEPQALDELIASCEAEEIRARRVPVDYASHTSHVERIEGELARVLAEVRPQPSGIPFFSTVTGDWADTTALDAGYWYRNLRRTVRFQEAVTALAAQDHTVFVEVSPHPVLAMSIQDTVDEAVVTGTLRREDGGLDRFLTSAGELWTHGIDVDWSQAFTGTGAHHTDLPTYPFQHRRYWLSVDASTAGDVAAVGVAPAGHPLLGAAVELPDGEGIVLTGRLSARAHSWLAGEGGGVLLPAAVFVELAVRAGDEAGCDVVEELTLQAPLVLPEKAGVQLRVRVAGADEEGRCAVAVHSRAEDAAPGAPWACHATGRLARAEAPVAGWEPVAWPPAGVTRVDSVDSDRVDALWRGADGELFAEVSLPDEQRTEAARYGLHPALWDAALLDVALEAARHVSAGGDAADRPPAPAGLQGVVLHAGGADRLRVRITGAAGRPRDLTVEAADPTGAAVATVRRVALEPLDLPELDGPRTPDGPAGHTGPAVLAGPTGPAGQADPAGPARPTTAHPVPARRPAPARRRARSAQDGTGQGLAARLTGLAEAEQLRLLTELVHTETAAVLGLPGPDAVETRRGFFELGFNSLLALELRNRLNAATGLRLPASFLFEHTRPAAVAAHLRQELTRGAAGAAGPAAGGIEEMFRQSFAAGRHVAGNELIMAASRLRDAFDAESAGEHLPEPVPLATGGARPRLFCLPAVVATAGPQQYARFAEHFRGRRDVTVLPEPGYLPGERIPADLAALTELHARALRRAAGDEPFVLVGHSAGGQIAHAVTAHLETLGSPPEALVLLDVPWPEDDADNAEVGAAMLGVAFDRERKLGGGIMNDVRLTAMGGYHRLLADWRPEPVKTPTLQVRATEPMPSASGAVEDDAVMLRVDWKLDHTARDVPGNHFSIVEEHAGATAGVVEEWLAGIAVNGVSD
ncbi:SDR family NAD(P)-dependent oxidoreductase [Streptomyces sp. NPDC018610]|uniref:SDR family NAD(P)-dependent oxidoreductase n=1 Tax=Streptomyces sp. NPDC018610 TaxID=3365049 RepID=UPI003787EF61